MAPKLAIANDVYALGISTLQLLTGEANWATAAKSAVLTGDRLAVRKLIAERLQGVKDAVPSMPAELRIRVEKLISFVEGATQDHPANRLEAIGTIYPKNALAMLTRGTRGEMITAAHCNFVNKLVTMMARR